MVDLKVDYDRKSSRLELFVRIVYSIILSIILGLWGFVAGILMTVQWLVILVTGERDKWLHDHIDSYLQFLFKSNIYLSLLSDERPL
ncbi:MAG: DUF4389 domain-containing protein [Nanoarchaeota archaeon]|nr:DUF4389 domain-containing protein [Nanoarchaeota archaeon]